VSGPLSPESHRGKAVGRAFQFAGDLGIGRVVTGIIDEYMFGIRPRVSQVEGPSYRNLTVETPG
jgi:hypothetical protein